MTQQQIIDIIRDRYHNSIIDWRLMIDKDSIVLTLTLLNDIAPDKAIQHAWSVTFQNMTIMQFVYDLERLENNLLLDAIKPEKEFNRKRKE